MHKRVPDTHFLANWWVWRTGGFGELVGLANWWVWRTGGFGDFFPQVEKNKNSEIKIKLRKCIKECLTPLF